MKIPDFHHSCTNYANSNELKEEEWVKNENL
jgi:hypothetical protein